MIKERELDEVETKSVYKKICEQKLKPFDEQNEDKCKEFYYELDGKQYRLIYDQSGDWFCDIIYEGAYK
jgi:hypothetical protein